jgi:TolB-like protein
MRFHFSGHVLDLERCELHRGDQPIPLEPQVFDLLVHLVRHRDHVVSKDELIAAVWSGRIVSDTTIDSRVKAVRQAVGDSGAVQRVVRTVPRKGVRFVADVREEAKQPTLESVPVTVGPAGAPPSVMVSDALPRPDRPSIAVLAFINTSGDPDQDHLAAGIADDIITELSRNRSLFVIARTSSFSYKSRSVDVKQVARELGVRYVVEGSVRRNGNQIRITAQLIDTGTDSHIWAERFDRVFADLFTVQDEITRAMVTAIDPAISHAERQRAMQKSPEELSAWEALQRILWYWSKGGDPTTRRDVLQQAVALNPRFALAHVMLARLYLLDYWFGSGPPMQESLRLAEAAARTALDLDPYCAGSHTIVGWVYYSQGDKGAALEEADIAITLNPNSPLGYSIKGMILLGSGQPAEAREFLATALRLDPRGPIAPTVRHNYGVGFYLERDYVAAEATFRRTIQAYPDYPRSYLWHAATLGQLCRAEEALAALNTAISASPAYFKNRTEAPAHKPPQVRPEDHEHMLEGLRKAGWQG